MPTAQQFVNYITANQAVAESADRIAASVAARGTPEFTQAFQTALIDHARDFGVAEERPGALELVNAYNEENPITPDPGGDDSGGDDSGGGDDTIYGPPPGDTGGGGTGIMGPVGLEAGALDPVTNLIGTTDSTGQSTLMGRQADLASDIAGVQSTVTPLAGQVTTLQDTVTPLAGDIGQVKTDVTDLATNVGTADANTGLFKPIGDIQTDVTDLSGRIGTADTDAGQTNLFAGQAGLAGQISGVGETATAVQGLMGAPTEGGPQTLFESQQQLRQRMGTPVGEQTDLFAGQAGLARGQQTLTSDVDRVGRDLSAEAANIQNQIRGFQQAAEEYQSGATAQRGNIENTAMANQNALMGQIGSSGLLLNQRANELAEQRQAEAAQFRAAQAPLQQQIANLTSNNQALQSNLQNIGPMGPMAADPRDALIQQLLTRNAALMNNRPV